MLVIGVIIVGVAIALGITMFMGAAYKANVQAITSELTGMRSQADQYWKLPSDLGGAGLNITRTNINSLGRIMGFEESDDGVIFYKSDNGEYRLTSLTETEVTIVCLGKESKGGKFPFLTYTFDFMGENGNVDISSAEGF
jgi:hypothetical protein